MTSGFKERENVFWESRVRNASMNCSPDVEFKSKRAHANRCTYMYTHYQILLETHAHKYRQDMHINMVLYLAFPLCTDKSKLLFQPCHAKMLPIVKLLTFDLFHNDNNGTGILLRKFVYLARKKCDV